MLLTREQLQDRLIALHKASLELVKDISLEHLLERIATTACEQSDARYAALGVFDADGGLEKFISVGLTSDEIRRIAHRPVGKGLLRALQNVEEPLRVPVIQNHPKSVGFPDGHPIMVSFLGVPIRAGDQQLGQIYLTDKIDAEEFTTDDEKIIQMLAVYAAAAIQNARHVGQDDEFLRFHGARDGLRPQGRVAPRGVTGPALVTAADFRSRPRRSPRRTRRGGGAARPRRCARPTRSR